MTCQSPLKLQVYDSKRGLKNNLKIALRYFALRSDRLTDLWTHPLIEMQRGIRALAQQPHPHSGYGNIALFIF